MEKTAALVVRVYGNDEVTIASDISALRKLATMLTRNPALIAGPIENAKGAIIGDFAYRFIDDAIGQAKPEPSIIELGDVYENAMLAKHLTGMTDQ